MKQASTGNAATALTPAAQHDPSAPFFAIRERTPEEEIEAGKATVFRIVVLGILLSLVWKFPHYPVAWTLYEQLNLEHQFFPPAFRNNQVLAGLILAPIITCVLSLIIHWRPLFLIQSFVCVIATAGLCWHQGSYNDVTFLTCFWASLWCCWYSLSMNQPIEKLLSKGQIFIAMIFSMILLGGAVGKWTPGYWSGEVLYQIYFVDRDFWLFNLLREKFDSETLRSIATGYSRMVIIVESSCAFLWLLPARVAAGLATSVLSGIVLFSNFNLLSVMFCLLALGIVGMFPRNYPALASDLASSRTNL